MHLKELVDLLQKMNRVCLNVNEDDLSDKISNAIHEIRTGQLDVPVETFWNGQLTRNSKELGGLVRDAGERHNEDCTFDVTAFDP